MGEKKMNKNHRVIWSQVRNCFVVAGENAKAKGKPSSTSKAIAAAVVAIFSLPGMAGAAPPSGQTPVTTALTAQQYYADVDITISNTGSITVVNDEAVYVNAADYTHAFVNNGSLLGNQQSETALVYFNGNVSGSITNNSSAISNSTRDGGTSLFGFQINGSLSGSLTNSSTGTIKVTGSGVDSAYYYGIYINDDIASTGKLTNAGNIIIDHRGNHTTGYGYGVYVGGDMAGNLTNSGQINVNVHADDSAYAYGIYLSNELSGTLNNSGTISVSAQAATEYASAYGVYVGGSLSGHLINSGTISATARVFSDSPAYAYGVYINNDLSGSLANSGTISATAINTASYSDYAYGVYVGGNLSGTLDNSGTISATANARTSYASAFGVYIDNYLSGSLINSGTISATATVYNDSPAYAYGVYVNNDLSGSLTNSGTISASAINVYSYSDYAYGVYVGGNLSGTLTNSGTISATAQASTSYAYAFGVYINNDLSGSLVNSGTISANARVYSDSSAYAYGVYVGGDLSGTLTNTGTISATAINSYDYSPYAYGVYVGGNLSGSLTNSGTISARAEGIDSYAYAFGVYVDGDLSGVLNNSGTISAAANVYSDSRAYAYGVYVRGDLSGSLTNSGTISANATVTYNSSAYAYGVYVSGDLSGSLTNHGTISATSITTGTDTYAKAFGVYLSGGLSGTLSNSGSISASANGVTSLSAAFAYGVYLSGTMGGTLSNSGSINATANNDYSRAYAYGVYANSPLNGTLENLGTISAIANGGSSRGGAYGIYARTLNGTLENSGTIRATGLGEVLDSNVYSIYADGGEGTINNQAGGLLDGQIYAGSNMYGAINVINDGTINTRLNDSFVGGTYTQGATGVLTIGVADGGEGNTYGSLTAGGAVTLAAGTTIRVNAAPSNTLVATDVLTNVISGSSLSMSTVRVADNLMALNFVASDGGEGGVNLTANATATGMSSVAAAVQAAGQGGLSGAAGALDGLLASIDSQPKELQDLLYSLGSSASSQEAANIVSQVQPLMSGGMSQATFGAMHGSNLVVQNQMGPNLGGASGDLVLGDKRVWVKPFGSWADQSDRKGTTGYDAKTYGVVVGADAMISDTNRIGAAFAYSRSNVDGNSSVAVQNADIDSYQGIFYGSHAVDARTEVNFQLDAGFHNNEGRRHVGTSVAKSDYDSVSAHAGVGLVRTMKVNDKTTFMPSVRADYSWIEADSYSENGAGALNLNVGKASADELILAVDGKLLHSLSDQTKVTANIGLGYDVINDQTSITAAFAGAPTASFVTKGIDASPWLVRGGLGLVYQAGPQTQITARYDVEGREDFSNQTASIKARWAF